MTRIFPKRLSALLLVAMAGMSLPASAAKLTTAPVRVDLSTQQTAAVINVTNDGDTDTLIQVDSLSWSQEGGEETYAPTGDILAVPAVFELKAGETQLVRVGLRTPPQPGKEHSYRIFLNEVSDESAFTCETVRVLLRIGIPVFVHSGSAEAADVTWNASCDARKQLSLKASNSGNAHARFFNLSLTEHAKDRKLVKMDSAGYLLPGATRTWERASGCPKAGSILDLSGETDAGPFKTQVVVQE